MLYERTAISRMPEDTYSERDLEAAILRKRGRFLLELGTDFSFIARQKRMTIGDRDFYLDLLFYHRSLHRLVAIRAAGPGCCLQGPDGALFAMAGQV